MRLNGATKTDKLKVLDIGKQRSSGMHETIMDESIESQSINRISEMIDDSAKKSQDNASLNHSLESSLSMPSQFKRVNSFGHSKGTNILPKEKQNTVVSYHVFDEKIKSALNKINVYDKREFELLKRVVKEKEYSRILGNTQNLKHKGKRDEKNKIELDYLGDDNDLEIRHFPMSYLKKFLQYAPKQNFDPEYFKNELYTTEPSNWMKKKKKNGIVVDSDQIDQFLYDKVHVSFCDLKNRKEEETKKAKPKAKNNMLLNGKLTSAFVLEEEKDVLVKEFTEFEKEYKRDKSELVITNRPIFREKKNKNRQMLAALKLKKNNTEISQSSSDEDNLIFIPDKHREKKNFSLFDVPVPRMTKNASQPIRKRRDSDTSSENYFRGKKKKNEVSIRFYETDQSNSILSNNSQIKDLETKDWNKVFEVISFKQ